MAPDPAHDLAHLDRVWMNAQIIARGETGVDMCVLVAASYLHDLINLPKDSPDRSQASRQSAEAAGPILAQLGLTADQIDMARHAIVAHSYSAGIHPETTEARIVRDADRLDALGAIGIARTFVVAGALDLSLYEPSDPFARNRVLDDHRYALDHWQVKLLNLANDMITDTGREMARKRVQVMLRFLDDLSAEIGADTPVDLIGPPQ